MNKEEQIISDFVLEYSQTLKDVRSKIPSNKTVSLGTMWSFANEEQRKIFVRFFALHFLASMGTKLEISDFNA